MTVKLPEKLGKSPLVEAICEVRFQPRDLQAGELLPGVLLTKLRQRLPQTEPEDVAKIPATLRRADPQLEHLPLQRFFSDSEKVRVGPRSILASPVGEYPGWGSFLSLIDFSLDALREADAVGHVERYSLRYRNIIRTTVPQLAALRLRVEAADRVVPERGFQLRYELGEPPGVTIIHIQPNAQRRGPAGEGPAGVLVDIDRVAWPEAGSDFLGDSRAKLVQLHDELKVHFFDLLTTETIASLEPTYAD